MQKIQKIYAKLECWFSKLIYCLSWDAERKLILKKYKFLLYFIKLPCVCFKSHRILTKCNVHKNNYNSQITYNSNIALI